MYNILFQLGCDVYKFIPIDIVELQDHWPILAGNTTHRK